MKQKIFVLGITALIIYFYFNAGLFCNCVREFMFSLGSIQALRSNANAYYTGVSYPK